MKKLNSVKELYLQVGNDNGNSDHKLVIEGDEIVQPNVVSKVTKLPNLSETNPLKVAKNIHNELIVTIESEKLNNGKSSTYYIGEHALKSGKTVRNIDIGMGNHKIDSDIPLINTLGHIAGYSVAKAFQEDNSTEEIKVIVDMTTALPVSQYNPVTTKALTEVFEGNHIVLVHLGSIQIKAVIEFDFVKVIPEGVPTVFYLQSNEEEGFFKNKRVLHVAIGEGTTEFPLTTGIDFNKDFLEGTSNGVGIAVEKVLSEFKNELHLPNFTRQAFSLALKDKNDKYHVDCLEYITDELENQSIEIYNKATKIIEGVNNQIDVVCVYGGGSILMEEFLKPRLERFCNNARIDLKYINDPISVQIESLGMYQFTTSDIFARIKEKNKR